MRYATIAVVLAGFCACGGKFTSGTEGPFLSSTGGTGNPPGADGGNNPGDAGDAGDAGDGGCAATPIPNALVLDNCDGAGISEFAVFALTPSTCTVNITFGSAASPCTGRISGANDAFSGSCIGTGLTNCVSTSLPGTINCFVPTGTCSIVVCNADAGSCN
jgi:hypothetical protein